VRFECINGCGAMIDVDVPPWRSDMLAFMLATAAAMGDDRFGDKRDDVERAIGRAVNEALYRHILLECTRQVSSED
jgi:hypothetical protein